MLRIAIFGAGDHGKVVLDSILNARNIPTDQLDGIFFIDDDKEKIGRNIMGVRVIGGSNELDNLISKFELTHFITALGNNILRAKLFYKAIDSGLKPITVINRFSYVSNTASIGRGTFIAPGAIIGVNARIEDNVIINTSASIDHDCLIKSHSTINPGAVLAGGVKVGNFSYIHSGAVVIPRIQIGDNTVVGAGAVVINDLAPNGVYVGVPATLKKHIDEKIDESLRNRVKNGR